MSRIASVCRLVILLYASAAATHALAAQSPLKLDAYAGYAYDDNVTRAQFDNDIESDNIFQVGASIANSYPVNDWSHITLRGTLDHSQYSSWSKLSNTLVGLGADYMLRPASGYTATRYILALAYEQRMFRSELRQGQALRARLGLSKNLTDVISIHAGYIRESIDADSDVFDADNNRLYLDLEYRTGQHNVLYTTLGYLDGNLVTTARGGLGIDYEIWVPDDAFSELQPLRWAYKLSGNAASVRLGNNYQIDRAQAIDASLFYYDSEADNYAGSSYSGLIFNASYQYRF